MIRVVAVLSSGLLLAGCFSQPPVAAVDRSSTAQSRSALQPTGPGYYTVKRGDTLYRIAQEHGVDYRDVAAWNGLANPSAIKEGQSLRVAPPAQPETSGAVVANPVAIGGGIESRPLDQPSASTAVQAAPPPAVLADNGKLKREPRVGKEPYSDEAYARFNPSSPTAGNAPAASATRPEATPPAAATPASPDDVPWHWPAPGKVIGVYSESGNKGLDLVGKAGDPVLAAGDGKVVYAGSGLRGYGELVIVKHNATFLSAYAHNRKILVKEGQTVSRGQKIAEMGSTDADMVKLHFEIRKNGKPVDPAAYLPKR
ncbi:peptidoglycan DD-metalloendopeptidase family protein [Azonexus sp.]|uniref:peptidoglycan DD-metalloendopeptidase family protein n=1 Tax=Azonexus sp. TaxID=1872668 RepID=UPI0035AFD7A0